MYVFRHDCHIKMQVRPCPPWFWLLQVRRWLISPIGMVSSANVMSLTDWWLEVQLLALKGEKAEEKNTALRGTGADDLGVEMCLPNLGFLLSDRKSDWWWNCMIAQFYFIMFMKHACIIVDDCSLWWHALSSNNYGYHLIFKKNYLPLKVVAILYLFLVKCILEYCQCCKAWYNSDIEHSCTSAERIKLIV